MGNSQVQNSVVSEENRSRQLNSRPPITTGHLEQRRVEMDSTAKTMEQRKTVLLYDPEKGNTSSAFTEALGKFITKLRFQHFEDATEEERHSYPILVVVRSTTVRFDEDLKQTAVLLEGLLGNLERVIAVYFQMNPVDSSRKHIESNSKGYNFWKIIDMDFSGTTFGQYRFNIFGFQFLNEEKPINVRAREEILLAYESLLNRNVTSVGVYYKKTLYAAGQFLEALGKLVYPRIHLRPAQHIDMLTHTNSATVVYLTSPSDIIEKNTFTDSRKVVVFRIFEVDTDNINGNKDDEPTLHPQPSVTQPLREVFIPCTEQYNCKFGRTFNILLGKDGLILCSLTMLKEFETFISECNSKQFK